MAGNTLNHSISATFPVPARRVWDVLLHFENRRLYGDMDLDLQMNGSSSCSGTVSIRGITFRLSASPYDIKMFSDTLRVGVRVKPAETGCTVIAASASSIGSGHDVDDTELRAFLDRLSAALTRPSSSNTAKRAPSPDRRLEAASEPEKEAERPSSEGETPEKVIKRSSVPKSKPAANIACFLIVLFLIAAGVLGLVKGRARRSPSAIPVIAEDYRGSDKLDIATAMSLEPGDSKSDIEKKIGKGTADGNGDIYLSSSRTGYGTPSVAVKVEYDGSKATDITVLDLKYASEIGMVSGRSLADASTPEQFSELAGCSPSMIRKYTDGQGVTQEYHYGYLDPRFNFSRFWRGQLWARIDSSGAVSCGSGYAYDGRDPLFHSRLTSSLLKQYNDFDSYLQDFYNYRFCIDMSKKPSRSEAMALIPSLTESNHVDETTLYNGISEEVLDDGSPLYTYTMGFGTRGDFVLFSCINRRLWDRKDQLDPDALRHIHSGMKSEEAIDFMGMLPSMVYIDFSYITMGFGSYSGDSDVLTEQFEFCIRLSMTDGTVESVYDNTGTQLVID